MSRNYLEAFIILLIAVGLGFFLVLPQYYKLQEAKMQIAEKNAEIENRQEYFAALSQARIELAQYEANLEKVESAFPDAIDAPALMNFTQTAAMQSGLIVKNISFAGSSATAVASKAAKANADETVPTLKLGNYAIEGELIGSYNNFKDFLSRLEFSSRLINAESIEVAPGASVDATSSKKTAPKTAETIKQDKTAALDPVLNFKVKLSANYYKK
jgi:Tfp pilus assembly protein PilO